MIAADEGWWWRGPCQVRVLDHDNSMPEVRPRAHSDTAPPKQLQPRIERDLPQRHHHLYVRQCADFRLEVIEAAGDFLGQRLVVGRGASDCRGDVRIRELQSVIRARGCRDVGEARSMERGHEEVARAAGTVAREYAARAVRSVRGRSEPEEQEACCLIAEAGDGSAPVRIVAVGALLFAGDSRAVRAQPRAAVARHDCMMSISQLLSMVRLNADTT